MGFKTIENRGYSLPAEWGLPITLAIHASKSDVRLGDPGYLETLSQEPRISAAFDSPKCTGRLGEYYWYGQTIVGLVDVIACEPMPQYPLKGEKLEAAIDKHFSQWPIVGGPAPDLPRGIWAFGPWCWILANPRRFERGITCRGAQRIWAVPMSIHATIAAGRQILLGADALPLIPEIGEGGIEPAVVGKPKILAAGS